METNMLKTLAQSIVTNVSITEFILSGLVLGLIIELVKLKARADKFDRFLDYYWKPTKAKEKELK